VSDHSPTPADDTADPQAPAPVEPVPTQPEPVTPPPAAPAPVAYWAAVPGGPAPVRGGGAGGVGAIAVSIAIVGVLLSGAIGAVAGIAASRIDSVSTTSTTKAPAISSADEPIAAAAATALPSVVNIDVTASSAATSAAFPQGHPDVPSGGTGSGVAYKSASDGGTYILTNNHVVEGASTIVVTPASGERMEATLVGTDPQTDIAVVKVKAKLPVISVADSEKLVVGQTVVAIGSPYGLQHSVSSGVVSALHRSITSPYSSDSTGTAYPLVDVIQTDAAINPGNSGGALVDRLGRLVGIDSAIYTESGSNAGIGFAIPSKTVVRIADELIAGGKATHPFLGVEGRTVTAATAKTAGLAKAEGAYIENVIPDTGAARAGLRNGDIVTALDGTTIRTMDDLILAVRRTQVGDKVSLKVWRDRAEITIEMTIGDKPASVG